MLMAFVLNSCNQKNKETEIDNPKIMNKDSTFMDKDGTMTDKDTTIMNNTSKEILSEKIYSCPMHPEVQGKLNDKCSKCGMDLTEAIPEASKK